MADTYFGAGSTARRVLSEQKITMFYLPITDLTPFEGKKTITNRLDRAFRISRVMMDSTIVNHFVIHSIVINNHVSLLLGAVPASMLAHCTIQSPTLKPGDVITMEVENVGATESKWTWLQEAYNRERRRGRYGDDEDMTLGEKVRETIGSLRRYLVCWLHNRVPKQFIKRPQPFLGMLTGYGVE